MKIMTQIREELFESIINDDIERFNELLPRVVGIDSVDENGDTFLHLMSKEGHTKFIEPYLKYNSRLNVYNKNGYTPLEIAIFNKNSDFAIRLIDLGASIIVNHNGYSLLHASVAHDLFELTVLLIKSGLEIDTFDDNGNGRTPLMWAAQNGNLEIFKVLLEGGANASLHNKDEGSALHIASSEGHLDIIKVLIHNGVDINFSPNGSAPIHNACSWNHFNVVKYLISKGVDINKCDEENNTPLDYAYLYSDEDLIKLLIENGGLTS